MPLVGASKVLDGERKRDMLIETARGGPGHEPIWEIPADASVRRNLMKVTCPSCSAVSGIAEDSVGKRVKCPHCEQIFLVRPPAQAKRPVVKAPPEESGSVLDDLAAASQGSTQYHPVSYAAQPPMQYYSPQASSAVRCPRCGHTQITSNRKGFGAGKTCLGLLLGCGIFSFLCGFLGSGKMFITCLSCGYQWRAGRG